MALVFIRKRDDFIRILTTVLNEEGKSVVGTYLDKNSKIYKRLILGKATLFKK